MTLVTLKKYKKSFAVCMSFNLYYKINKMEMEGNKSKKKPTKMEEMTKEQIRKAIVKKRECNAKAQNIVESLLEKCISEEYFLKCLPDINQSHLEDIIEERSIIRLCGYPLCQKTITEQDIPKQKYRISVKTNKVYDITTRKSFCSNTCYKSAMYIKKQMLTSPLWFREYEDIPKFHLLTLDTVGSLGQEVDLGLIERIDIKSELKSFTSINDFTHAGLSEMQNNEINLECSANDHSVMNEKSENESKPNPVLENNSSPNSSKTVESQKDAKTSQNIEQNLTKNIPEKISDKKQLKPAPNPLNIVGEIIEKPEKKIDPILLEAPIKNNTDIKKDKSKSLASKILSKKQPSVAAITIEVEKCLAEWFTLDTLLFLFGEEKVKEIVADKGEFIKEYLNNHTQSMFYKSNSYDQYQALCRKLNMLELEDKRYDAQTLSKEMKPLPDYTMLKEESKKMQLKVKAFFAGETVIPDVENVEVRQLDSSTEEEEVTQLPLVDKNAQNALRRRIVCQHLNKVLPDLLRSLGLLTLSISSDVRMLVNTFQLQPNNIMFKPIQWTLIAIVFIKLLSLRDGRLEYLLKQPMAFQHMQLLLLSYKQDGGYLDRLISWLTDIDRLLDVSDKQLTVE
ncbi:putative RNA polymerase II subunit B1 CTD phosphatase RPAP2 [Colias croceus]|uniref:putative RNA polymerase II subunit B1 CTD phosphatase RPAP2 n=1 Tax=Colias crocea TaxID=72248 RepID=UPI001E27A4EF|nr:putative RNA polymerase II subunit B1 CTD phosphatase RPAP2 [Colias croceus]